MPHIADATHNPIENIMEIDFSGAAAPCPYGGQPPKNNVQTTTEERSSDGEATRFILPSYSGPQITAEPRPETNKTFRRIDTQQRKPDPA